MKLWRHYNCNKCSFYIPFAAMTRAPYIGSVVWFPSLICQNAWNAFTFSLKCVNVICVSGVSLSLSQDEKWPFHSFNARKTEHPNETINSHWQRKTEEERLIHVCCCCCCYFSCFLLFSTWKQSTNENACNLIRAEKPGKHVRVEWATLIKHVNYI